MEALRLPEEHIAPLELSAFYESVLVGVDVAVCLPADVGEEFAEVKGGVSVEEVPQT